MTLRIDPDGTIQTLDGDVFTCARAEFKFTSVLHCRAPFLDDGSHAVYVGIIEDFSAQDMPLNRKAWALYGGSPIYGPMFFGRDETGYVTGEIADMVRSPITEWRIPDEAIEVITTMVPERPAMLARREEANRHEH